jgi:hypothetical protein
MLGTTTFESVCALPAEHINLFNKDVKSRFERGPLIHLFEMSSNHPLDPEDRIMSEKILIFGKDA